MLIFQGVYIYIERERERDRENSYFRAVFVFFCRLAKGKQIMNHGPLCGDPPQCHVYPQEMAAGLMIRDYENPLVSLNKAGY